MGLIEDADCRTHLRDYLSLYLPLQGRIYDQLWAVGALAHIEGAAPKEFLEPALWADDNVRLDPEDGIRNFQKIVEYVALHKMALDL